MLKNQFFEHKKTSNQFNFFTTNAKKSSVANDTTTKGQQAPNTHENPNAIKGCAIRDSIKGLLPD
jgi:hypothetical protein